ncbi:hypothetical protein GCM10028822_28120 [Hymenobacter terrigena]
MKLFTPATLSCFALTLAILTTGTAAAQSFLPPSASSSDGPPVYANNAGAGTQAGANHTGTDVIRLKSSDQNLQAMVWDYNLGRTTVTLSWSKFTAGSTVPVLKDAMDIVCTAGGELSDPDVAMAYYNGNLYADVVYLSDASGANRVYRNVYLWNGSAFVMQGSSLPLGSGNQLPNVLGFQPDPVLREHSAPNIDANADGVVGIAWQESSVETAQITVVSASYPPPGYTYISRNLTFAEGYFLLGQIDGGLSCNTRGFAVSRDFSGTAPYQNPPVLANQTLLPDIAVTPQGKIWLAYINSSATQGPPPVTAGINLVIKQVSFDICQLQGSTGLTRVYAINDVVNPPRIAATPNINAPNEMEVVRAQTSGGGCFSGPAHYIFNYGYANNEYHEVAVINAEMTDREADEPVVAYYGGDNNKSFYNQYIVSWTGRDYENGQGKDIWSRTWLAGLSAGTGDYSRVNTLTEGDQLHPSVAARYCGDSKSSAHLFVNQTASDLGYKLTNTPAGTPLNRVSNQGNPTSSTQTPVKAVQAFPNPFTQTVDFSLHLQSQESVQRLQVTDLSGRVLETLTLPAAGEQTISWHPKQALPTGSYMVRMVTNKRTETISLGKQ